MILLPFVRLVDVFEVDSHVRPAIGRKADRFEIRIVFSSSDNRIL